MEENCDLFPEARLEHPDAEPGAAGPHMAGELDVQYADGVVRLNGTFYRKGKASGAGCNCLIEKSDRSWTSPRTRRRFADS